MTDIQQTETQTQPQHEEHPVSETIVTENGHSNHNVKHDEHNGGTILNGDAKTGEAELNGDSSAAKDHADGEAVAVAAPVSADTTTTTVETETPSAAASPCKPKRSGSRAVKDFFSHIFKRGKAKENNGQAVQDGQSPKKETVKKEKAAKKEKQQEQEPQDKDVLPANGSTETETETKPTATDDTHVETQQVADADGAQLAVKVEANLKIEDCAADANVKLNGHEKLVDECKVEKCADEKLAHVCADETAVDEKKCVEHVEHVGGDAANTDSHDS